MSGDLGPRVAILAAEKFVADERHCDIWLFGDEHQLRQFYKSSRDPYHQINIVHCTEKVTMDDNPLHVIRHKKSSSMYQALSALARGEVDASVSAGNTGALLVMAKHLIGTLDGIDRPAICKSMPVNKGQTFMLELGANINCTPEQLHQFALMASTLVTPESKNSPAIDEDQLPKVGLLNIGTEHTKGTDLLQQAQNLFAQEKRFDYVGFIEANAIFSGSCDVIACDGFHGNIALKASEGTARFINDKIQLALRGSFITRICLLLIWPVIKSLRHTLDPALYNGASLLGLKKTVIKSHGNADQKAFMQAIRVAYEQALQNIPQKIHSSLN
jgi:glycerol-3-phosphate acyltransferase PlsX